MPNPTPTQHSDPLAGSRLTRGAARVLGAAIGLAYCNSFSGPFVLDDIGSIVDNPTIRSLWPPWGPLQPIFGSGETVSGRPLLNFSFALNYAAGGLAVGGYHVVNLVIHMLAALLLFGIVRRTVARAIKEDGAAAAEPGPATWVALTVAGLWALHPLQTESVTYIVQRAEALVGLCYLATLYGFIRGAAGERRWLVGSVVACLAGMAAKEVIVSAPLMVWLYDRTFVAGSFRETWRLRRRYYLALAATWLLLGGLVMGNLGRGGSAGLGTEITPWTYALTQCGAIIRYLGLVVWPRPLVFDYGTATVQSFSEVAPQTAALVALLVATGVALVRWPAAGFLGAWFFAILAPSSSVIPVVTQTVAEHRMYLPLAAVITGVVIAGWRWAGGGSLIAFALGAAVCLGLTRERNRTYRSMEALWADTVQQRPDNPRAHSNLAAVLVSEGRFAEAMTESAEAVRLDPRFVQSHINLAYALAGLGRRDEAIAQLREALRIAPESADAHNNLGRELATDPASADEAMREFRRALELKPDYVEALCNLGLALAQGPKAAEGIPPLERAVALKPDHFGAHNNLGIALARSGRVLGSLAAFARAAALNPRDPGVEENWAKALQLAGNEEQAARHFQRARELRAGR